MKTFLPNAVEILSEASRLLSARSKKKQSDLEYIADKFFKSVPDFEDSLAEKQDRSNGITMSGAWPVTGKHVYDWEIDVMGQRGGDFVVKFSMWGADGKYFDGHSFNTNIATVDRLVPKFVTKYFLPMKNRAKMG